MIFRDNTFIRTAAIALVLLTGAAWGMINPDFTPIDLVRQSGVILAVKEGETDGNTVSLAIDRALKGDAPAGVKLDIAPLDENLRESLAQLLKAEPSLIFISEEGGAANLNAGGRWFPMKLADNGEWAVIREDTEMAGLLATWRGGTDMLMRCVVYILEFPEEAQAPSEAGFGFIDAAEIGQAGGDVADLFPVIFDVKGPVYLYIASPAGDLLIKGGDAPEDIAAEVGLRSRSKAAAWGDFNGNRRIDLASFDGESLSLWLQAENGKFSKHPAGIEIPATTNALAAMNIGGAGRADLLAIFDKGFVLLKNNGEAFEVAARFDLPDEKRAQLGEAGKATAADFTNDGFIDLLQPYEKGGLLYRGTGDGGYFLPPVDSEVSSGIGMGKMTLCDLDGDGLIDLVLTSFDGVRIYHNAGDGRFVETRNLSGETTYKTQRFASGASVGDPNADGREDLMISYLRETVGLFFNRGFRSFGFAMAQSGEVEDMIDVANGQKAACFIDLAGDGAEGISVVLADGGVWYLWNELGDENPAYLMVHAPASSGPIAVECSMPSRSLGRKVASPGRPARFSIPDPGQYKVEWRLPGSEPVRRKIIVINDPENILIEENE